MRNRFISSLLFVVVLFFGFSVPAVAECTASPCIVANSNAISLTDTVSSAALNSSAIAINGFSSNSVIASATLTLNNWTETDGGNVHREFFLVYTPIGSSNSYSYQFLSELGDSSGFSNITVTLDDSANTGPVSIGQPLASNTTYTYLPTVGLDASYSQSPPSGAAANNANFAGPFGTASLGSVFGGLPANGTWTLYVYDAVSGDAQASVGGGWTIAVTTAVASTTSTSVTPSVAEAFIGDTLTLTAKVTDTVTPSVIVSEGTVTFTDTTTGAVLGSSGVVSGNATLNSVAFSAEGSHSIAAQYKGDSLFGASSTSTKVFIDHPTSSNGPTFCNSGANSIDTTSGNAGSASVYPQHIFVTGLNGSLTDVSLQLSNLQNVLLTNFNVLLVGPSGATEFVALAGGGGASAIPTGTSLVLSDFGGLLPLSGVGAGPYLPTDSSAGAAFGSPAPAGPYALAQPQGSATFATTFASELNGLWSLYVYDSKGGDSSTFGGYCLTFTTSSVAATTTVVSTSAAEATVGEQVTFTATVTSNGSPVAGGTVTFQESGKNVSGPTTVDGNGQAIFRSSSLAEGLHTISAVYSGVPGTYNISSANASLEVDTPTTVSSANIYCNPGGIVFPSSGSSSPYPSRVNVTNLPGTVNAVTVTLHDVISSDPAGLGLLLTGPSATNIVLWKEAGGSTSVSNDNLTLDDSAGPTNPVAFPLPTSGSYTYYPTATTAGGAFPAPAPVNVSYAPPAGTQTLTSAFQNLNGNGFWSLYTFGAAGQAGNIGNWCLNFTENPPVLSVGVSGPATLTQGQTGAQYTITITNNGPGSTGGTTPITVNELPGPGFTVAAMSGTGWDCGNLPVCTSTAVIPENGTSTITATLNVGNSAGSPQANSVSVSGGGSAGTVTDSSPLSITILAPTVTMASNAVVAFSSSAQSVVLTAALTANGETVSGGTVTFSVYSGATQIGSPGTSGAVSNGNATATVVIPAGVAPGTYLIQAVYSGAGNFMTSSDNTHALTVGAAGTNITANNATAIFNSSAQNVTLSATVTSPAGTVNGGNVTFTVLNGGSVIGSPVTSAAVANGVATATYSLPAGTAPGSFIILAVYNAAFDFASTSDATHSLTISGAPTTIAAANVTATFNANAQNVALSAMATSAAGVVNSGNFTFTVLNNGAPIGLAVTSGTVVNGSASAVFSLPGGTAVGSYTIQAAYSAAGNFASGNDAGHTLTIAAAQTTITASNAAATFSPNPQNVTLSANITSAAGTVNSGTVSFTVLNNGAPVGSIVTSGAITNGFASAPYSLPGSTGTGIYTVLASYNAAGNFAASSDNTHNLTVSAASTAIAANNVSATFSSNAQNVALSANVTSSAGMVNAGTVTFTLLNNGTTIGTAITSGTMANGNANATYSLPAGTAAGSYTIQAAYNAGGNFAASTDNAHNLTVGGAATTVVVSNASATFNPNVQIVTLSATVTSAAGPVNTGTVTFSLMNNGTLVGSAATSGIVTGGAVSVAYSLPAGAAAGSYTIQAVYNAAGNFAANSDSAHTLTIGAASSAITASNASVTFSSSSQNLTLSAAVTSPAGIVNGGTVTFSVLSGNTLIGSAAISGAVVNGAASAVYSLPGGTSAGPYIVQAIYNPGGNFAGSSDSSHSLNVSAGSTAITASAAAATFSPNAQNITLSAAVTSASGPVNTGTVTFTVLGGGSLLGSPVTSGTLANGTATATFSLPGGTVTGAYTMVAVYNGSWNLVSSSDATHNLTVSGALTTITASGASATFNPAAQNVALSATVTSLVGTVNAGTVTFTLLSNGTPVGSAVTSATVTNGVGTASYSLPGGTAAGTYTIQAAYSGGGNFAAGTDNGHTLNVVGAGTTIAASNVSAIFSPNAQSVTLAANVTSTAGTVNGGTVTFTLLNSGNPVGSPVTSTAVTNGGASATYSLPGGTDTGTYTIQSIYNPNGNFAASTDSTHSLTVTGAATTIAAANAVVTFSPNAQNVALIATVASAAGTVNAGTVTFTILSGGIAIGSPATSGTVAGGSASATYSLPGGTAVGTYTIQATFNAGGNFATSTENAHNLTVNGAASATVGSNTAATFNPSAQNVSLSATVTSPAGTVNTGNVTFTVLNAGTPVGAAVSSGTVANGTASAVYSLPGGTGVGTYTIQASYSGGGNFAASADSTHTLSVGAAATTISASNVSATFNANAQAITLSASVTSGSGTVNSGTVTFTVLNGASPIGSSVTSTTVTNGAAAVTYSLPGGTPSGTYTLQAVYNAVGNFANSSDSAHTFTVSGPTTTVGSNASSVYGSGTQSVTLSASVTSTVGTVNAGAVTFSVYSGTTLIGSPVTSGIVANGSANAIYLLPTGTAAGTYTIQAAYAGGGIFAASSDSTHTLTVSGAITTTRVTNASTTYGINGQSVAVSATVSSSIGSVGLGTVTFTVLSGGTAIGSSVTTNTSGTGNASTIYTLPGGTAAGTYTIQAVYNGGGNFGGSSDNTGVLSVGRAATQAAGNAASATFNPNAQNVTLSASIVSAGVLVNSGTVTFTVLNNGTPIGSPVTSGTLASGTASATYSLPGGTPIGAYTIQAAYSGGGNFAGSSDSSQSILVGGAITITASNNVTAAFSATSQNVTLSAAVTSSAGIVNSGTVTFTVLTPVATTVTGTVANGSASVTYPVPAATASGTYTIQAVYNAGGNFATSSDVAHNLTLTAAPTTTTASSTSVTFGSNAQNLMLSAAISSAAGVVNSGTVTFTILNYGNPIGSAATSGTVTNGTANATYSLPGGTPEGAYTIQAVYSGGGNFAGGSENMHTLSVGPAVTTTLGIATVTAFSSTAQNVVFSATITSTAGTVNSGTVTFTLLSGGTPVGTPVTSNVVSNGTASVAYLLPGGTGIGMYTILAAYNAGWDFSSSSDGTHSLTVTGAATTIAANNALTSFSASAQAVTLSASVTSASGTVTGGNVTFTVWNGNTEIGSAATSGTVTNGTASGTYVLPGNTPAGTYIIQAAYSGGGSFAASNDAPVTLTVTTQAGALMFVPIAPCRVADTRNPTGPFGAPQLAAGSTRNFTIPGSACGIPSTALAYSLNATVIPSKILQYLTLWPTGQVQPNVSTLNSLDGRIKANAAVVPAGTNGAVSIYATDATQVILDINGYYVPAGTASSLAFYPMTPCRIADTRQGTGPLSGPSIGAGTSRSFPVLSSSCNVPSTAQAYSLNFTAVPSASLFYMTTWATGAAQPNVSTLNALTGAVTANAALVPAGTNGSISVYSSDTTDLVMDIDGYFAPPGTGGLSLYTLTPCRVLDTRAATGGQPFNGNLVVNVAASNCGVPVSAKAYGLNATVVPPGPLTYLALWANGQAQPLASTLNAYDGDITSNMAIVPSTDSSIDAFSSNATHLILDISSYYAP